MNIKQKIKPLLYLQLLLLPFALKAQEVQYVVSPDNSYSTISNFSDGLAKVEIKYDSIGFIDRNGKMVFTKNLRYNDVGNFHDGRASVGKEIDGTTKYGYINKQGKLVIPIIYAEVKDFSDSLAMVYKDFWQVINHRGKTVMSDSLLITEMHNNQGGYDVEPPSFHNGLMLSRKENLYGYVNKQGKVVIPYKYKNALDFKDGIALVAEKVVDKGKTYKGHSVLDSIYNSLPGEDDEYPHWEVIDTTGKVLYKFPQNKSPYLVDDLAEGTIIFETVVKVNGFGERRYGIVNKYGKMIVPPKYDNNLLRFSDGVAIAQVHGKKSNNADGYMLIYNLNGEIVGKSSFMTKYGLMFDSNLYFHEGLLSVKIHNQEDNHYYWGYINKKGDFVIKPQFNKALDFHDGRAVVVTKDGKIAVIKNPLKKHDKND